MPTTSSTVLVEHALLVQSDGNANQIPIGSPAWYAWLTGATAFAFRSSNGTFTAHKEQRGPSQSYWKAYRRRAGKLHRVYLGRSQDLTLDRLNTAAAELAGEITQAAQPALDRDHPASDALDSAQSLHLLSTKLTVPTSPVLPWCHALA